MFRLASAKGNLLTYGAPGGTRSALPTTFVYLFRSTPAVHEIGGLSLVAVRGAGHRLLWVGFRRLHKRRVTDIDDDLPVAKAIGELPCLRGNRTNLLSAAAERQWLIRHPDRPREAPRRSTRVRQRIDWMG